jgi:hypothetical protein
MKSVCVSAVVLVMALSLQAQSSKFYVDILPGCQLNSSTALETFASRDGDSYTYSTTSGRGFAVSLDGGYFFTDHVALHVGYLYGTLKRTTSGVIGGAFSNTYSIDGHYNLFEIGPEFDAHLSPQVWVYGQLNVGHTFGGSQTLHLSSWGPIYLPPDSQEWTMGAALGIRWVPGPHWGLAAQLGYHRFNQGQFNDYWDARLGVVIRF